MSHDLTKTSGEYRIGSAVIGLAVLIAAAVSGCSAAAPPKPNIEHMLANARTAADHDAIANYYEDEAADAVAKQQEHKALAVQYGQNPRFPLMAGHCDSLAQEFKGVEEDESALAAEHRKIAVEMKSGQSSVLSGPSPQSGK